jgi:LuxR family transcriptional regulator
MQDPAIAWAFGNQGMVRWDDLASQDLAQVFPRAREHGLVHGMTISVERGGSRSIGGFARPDRFFTSEEVARIEDGMGRLHDLTDAVQPLPEPVRESLRKLSVAFTHP